MKPEDPNVQAWLEPELEARLVASLLGEASAFEEAELQRLIAERPEIAVFQRRLEAVHGLVDEATSQGPDDDWKLSKDRRSKVLETIRGKSEKDTKVTAVVAKKSSRSFWYGAAAVASVAVFAGMLLTMSMNLSSRATVAANESRDDGIDMKKVPETVEFEGFVNYAEPSSDLAMLGDLADSDRNEALSAAISSPESLDLYAYQEDNKARFGVNKADFFDDGLELTDSLEKADVAEGVMLTQARGLSDADFTQPEIITRSGSEGQTEIVREPIHPEVYDPPELAQSSGGGLAGTAFPVTPPAPITAPQTVTGDGEPTPAQRSQTDRYFATRNNAPELNVHGRPRMSQWAFNSNDAGLEPDEAPNNTTPGKDVATPGDHSEPGFAVGGAFTSVDNVFQYLDFGDEQVAQQGQADSQSPPSQDIAATNTWGWDVDSDGVTDLFGDQITSRRGGTRELGSSASSSDGAVALNSLDKEEALFFELLQADKYSTAARQGLERVEKARSDYLSSAYDQTRAELLDQLMSKWETPVPSTEPSLTDSEAKAQSPEARTLSEQEIKVEEARLAMLDQAERYRNIDFAAMQSPPAETEALSRFPIDPNITRDFDNGVGGARDGAYVNNEEETKIQLFIKAKETFEAEKRDLQRLEEESLSEALAQAGDEEGGEILDKQLAKLAEQEGQVAALGERYQIPALLKRQSDITTDGLSATVTEAKKDTSMDDQRKLEEFKEAQEKLYFRRKLVAKAKQAVQPAKPQSLSEKQAKQTPFSTFSLHVSDVAFKLAKAALLEQNRWPEVAKVRIEEFVNAFDYGDPAPSQAEKVACQIEQAAHPFRQQRNVLRVSMRTAEMGRASGTPLQITLLLDTSGSMERADRQESIARAMQVLTSQLTPNDTVTLIGFARQPRLIQDRLTGDALKTLPSLVKQTPSEGGTNLEEALLLGADHARRQFVDGGQNRIVLITDGAANLGDADAESLRELVVGLRQEGIAFDACGVGAEGLNDTILEALTRQGDGRYYLLNKPEDADAGFARQLAGAFRPAARNVKVQVRFNDQRVGKYRLLGFEKHRLKKEDFRNDKVDAAEMASAEAGVALYEFEPLPQGDGEVGEVSVRFQDMTSSRMVERTWTIAYEEGVPVLEEASPSLQLASTAAFLAEKLKGTTFGQSIDLDQLSQTLTNIRQRYGSSQTVTDLIAMIAKVKEL